MKGLSTTILIVVTAVVILVAALVLLTIFGGGIQNVATITQAQSLCTSSATITCSTGSMPATWSSPSVRVAGGNPQSCAQLFTTTCTCTNIGKNCVD